MEQKWSELRLWNGGICPVGPDDAVWGLLENMSHYRAPACAYNWSHRGGPWDIIAYRVEVKPKPLIERWVNISTDSNGDDFVVGELYHTLSDALKDVRNRIGARQILLREVRE